MANSTDASPELGRPESTIAQSFATDLDDLFGLRASVDGLSQTVEEKKRNLSTLEAEQAALESRLRETEQRLARVSRHNSPSRAPHQHSSSPRQQASPGADGMPSRTAAQPSPLSQRPAYPSSRPPTRPGDVRQDTAQMMVSGMPGGLPETPTRQYSVGDYVMVDRNREGRGEHGQSVGRDTAEV